MQRSLIRTGFRAGALRRIVCQSGGRMGPPPLPPPAGLAHRAVSHCAGSAGSSGSSHGPLAGDQRGWTIACCQLVQRARPGTPWG